MKHLDRFFIGYFGIVATDSRFENPEGRGLFAKIGSKSDLAIFLAEIAMAADQICRQVQLDWRNERPPRPQFDRLCDHLFPHSRQGPGPKAKNPGCQAHAGEWAAHPAEAPFATSHN